MLHELKTWPEYFRRVFEGEKTFEVRKNDRDFQKGDTIKMIEYDPNDGKETGRVLLANVGYVLHGGQFGIEDGYCVFSISHAQYHHQ